MLRSTLLLLTALALAAVPLPAAEKARNVILFVGDAAGVATVHGASVHEYGKPLSLYLQTMPHLAMVETSTAGAWVTDSAASMTAIVTGRKTNNGVIAQSAAAVRGKKDGAPLKTILEYAEEHGLATGVVSNSSTLSATPAACYAHVNDRGDYTGIFKQLLDPRFGDGVDVVLGAGAKDFDAAAATLGMNLERSLKTYGMERFSSLQSVPGNARRAAVLFDDAFDLTAATAKAIQILSRRPQGYFLMVEGDCHTHQVIQGLERMVELDNAIRGAAEMVDPDRTLILFTADHSYDFRIHSGDIGEPLLPPDTPASWEGDNEAEHNSLRRDIVRRDNSHTAEYVMLTAQGPGAERVHGFLPNTAIFDIMMAAFGWE